MPIRDSHESLSAVNGPRTAQEAQLPTKVNTLSGTILTVQALRALAALLVVLEHCIYLWNLRIAHYPEESRWMNGAAGVDIFFVISGFVMTVSLPALAKYANPVQVFLRRRTTRIVPLYWLATALKLSLLVVAPGLAVRELLTVPNILGSFLFLFVRNAQNEIAPVIVVGWTLNFEMFFYVIFSLAMLWKDRIFVILASVLAALAVLSFFSQPSWPTVTAFASPLLLEFLYGVGIARLAALQRMPGKMLSSLLLAMGFVAILALFPHLTNEPYQLLWRFIFWGVPAAAIVLGAVGLEKVIGPSLPRWLISLGDASYAIYLAQTFVLPVVGIALLRLGVKGYAALALSITVGLTLSAGAGEVVHRFIEKPILLFLKNRQQRGAGASA